MKKFLKGIIVLAAFLVAIVVGGAYMLPEKAIVERHVVIKAPPEEVYAVVSSMKRFNEWSPWADLDPATQYVFAGPDSGIGQKMSWTSKNPNVGTGSQTIIEAADKTRTVTEIDFGEMGKATATLTLAPVDGGTGVTWRFETALPGIIERWMGPMMDGWIGADYVKGLGRLKDVVEKGQASG